MICDNCGSSAAHIVSMGSREHCENCSDLPVTSKAQTEGLLTRTSWRVRRQQSRFEGDMVTPHIYDKTAHRQRLNPEFLKLYPNQVKEFFTPEQLKADGYDDLPKAIAKNTVRREAKKRKVKEDTIYQGSSKKAVENFLGQS